MELLCLIKLRITQQRNTFHHEAGTQPNVQQTQQNTPLPTRPATDDTKQQPSEFVLSQEEREKEAQANDYLTKLHDHDGPIKTSFTNSIQQPMKSSSSTDQSPAITDLLSGGGAGDKGPTTLPAQTTKLSREELILNQINSSRSSNNNNNHKPEHL